MKHPKVWTTLALLMLAGCGPREQLTIIRNVQAPPPPDIEAKVVPLEQPRASSAASTADATVPKSE